jgi:hypothetical protein
MVVHDFSDAILVDRVSSALFTATAMPAAR